jgi:hypothetical protein
VLLRLRSRGRASLKVRSLGRVDPVAYLRAVPLLVRNPGLALAPLMMSVGQVLLFMVVPMDSGGGILGMANASITSLIAQLLNSFGLAVSLIMAEAAWRRGSARFDDAWEEARRKAGDILLAALGYSFVIWVATLVGGIVPYGAIVLWFVASVFFVYTLPAAAIGGVPGGAALQSALERAQSSLLPALIVTIVYVFVYYLLTSLVTSALLPVLVENNVVPPTLVWRLIVALIQSVAAGYVALVLAKAYGDASYGRYFPR